MHSAAWDHSVELAGKRVAVIGTGASAIQLIPEIAPETAHVDVFQRTPPWVMPRTDFKIHPWMKTLFRRFPPAQRALRSFIWALQESVAVPLTKQPALTKPLELAGRLHMRRAIADPELRRRITPSYKVGCKRILPSNAYYPALAREDVDIVTDPIARIVPGGIETASGELREADVLVCATGFDIREALEQGEVQGRGGVSLGSRWAERIEAHRGTMMSGFPNLFILSGPNTGTGNMSQVFMIEAQVRFVRQARRAMAARGVEQIEVRDEAQRAHNEQLRERMAQTVWLTGGCNSWYLTDDGHTGVLWPGFSSTFRRELSRIEPAEYEFGPRRIAATEPAAFATAKES
jgi:cation diffusion facilitator CzcD-associated flavoprotein CzcO